MIFAITKFVKGFVALTLIIGSMIPLAASAAPASNVPSAPTSDVLASEGRWVCTGVTPPGWVRTDIAEPGNRYCGRDYYAFYIEPLVPGRSYWVCEGTTPAGWVRTDIAEPGNRFCGGSFAPYYAFHIEYLVAGQSYWICENTAPPGWVITDIAEPGNRFCGGSFAPYYAFRIEPL